MQGLEQYRVGKNVILQLLGAKVLKKRIPARVFLQLTKYCNLRCRHCWVYQNDYKNGIEKARELSTKEMLDLIDLLYDRGTRWINFLGGEPLLREDLDVILDHARKKGMYCEMSTNGMLVEKKIGTLRKVHNLCISIDGDKESNDLMRGQGTYEQIIKAIKIVVNHKIPLRLHSVLTRYTMNSLDNMVKLAKKFNLKFNFAECSLPNIDNRDPNLVLSDHELETFYQKYKKYKQTTKTVASSLTAINYVINWPLKNSRTITKKDLLKLKPGSFYPCLLGERSCMVDVDGKVYSCPERWKEGLSLFDVGFDKAWDYLKNKNCLACRILGSTEQSLTLDLHPIALFNAITNFA